MATPGSMAQAAQDRFNEDLTVVLPRLMRELKAPHRAAAALGVAPTSARKWLVLRGWRFDSATGEWVEPEQEPEHV